MNFFIGIPILRNLIHTVTSLVQMTEADRIQAGVFLGEEESSRDPKQNTFPASTVEEANLRLAQDE